MSHVTIDHNRAFFDGLFDLCYQVTPYLNGSIGTASEPSLRIGLAAEKAIKQLYDDIAKQNPEAGQPYWITRTWGLLSWQPVYVAFISVYGCRGLPKLTRMSQNLEHGMVSGFSFPDTWHEHAPIPELIQSAGEQIQSLFTFYRAQFEPWGRIRPGFTDHLLADHLVDSMIKVRHFYPEMRYDEFLSDTQMWLTACGLSNQTMARLDYQKQSNTIRHVRMSCCLVYKCAGGKLCDNCPRLQSNRSKRD